jgi:hypothetical protein
MSTPNASIARVRISPKGRITVVAVVDGVEHSVTRKQYDPASSYCVVVVGEKGGYRDGVFLYDASAAEFLAKHLYGSDKYPTHAEQGMQALDVVVPTASNA